MGFFEGFEKRAGFPANVLAKASKGNLEAVENTAKRMRGKLGPGTVDLGQWWKEPVKSVPRWKETLAKA